MTQTKAASRTVVKTWHKFLAVGIYDNCSERIRLWEDRITVRYPYVKWIGTTGGYAETHYRITNPAIVAQLQALVQAEIDDDADYTEEATEIAEGAIGLIW